jgi:hypothetical protein
MANKFHNTIKMIRAQETAGREIRGTVVSIGVPYAPRAELIGENPDGKLIFQEQLPEDSKKEPRVWAVDDENSELVHYIHNPNPKPVEFRASVAEDGTFTVNGEKVRTGAIKVKDVLASIPGEVMVMTDDGAVMRYEVQSDRFFPASDIPKLNAPKVKVLNNLDRRVVIYDNVVKDGELKSIYLGTDVTDCRNFHSIVAESAEESPEFLARVGVITDVIPVEGNDDLIIVKTLPAKLEKGKDDEETKVLINTDEDAETKSYFVDANDTFVSVEDELPIQQPVKATECAGTTTVIGADAISIDGTVIDNKAVVEAVTDHPYFTGRKTVYDEDGHEAWVWAYTDGESVVRFKTSRDDRGFAAELIG